MNKTRLFGVRLTEEQIAWLKKQEKPGEVVRNLIDRAMRQDALAESWKRTAEEEQKEDKNV